MKAALLWLFAAAQAADAASTAYGLTLPGLYEGNPAMAWCMEMLGPWWWLPKLGVVLFAVVVARRVPRPWPLGVVAGLTFLAALNNLARF